MHNQAMKTIEQKEALAAERVSQAAYSQVLAYTKNPDDLEAAHLGLLWAAFVNAAKAQGLRHWRDVPLDEC
jgi:hypothetical protein